jgi:hypothetical protein
MHYVGAPQRANRFHINDEWPAIGADQVVGHTANPFPRNHPSQLEGLADYLSRRWIEVGQHESPEFKSRLVSNVRVLGGAPIQAGIVFLSQVPRECSPGAASGDGFRIETSPLSGDDAAVSGSVGSFDEVLASLGYCLHY